MKIVNLISNAKSEGGMELPKDSEIYDFGCGNGFNGKRLTERGYTNIVGSDPSDKFIKGGEGVYKELRVMFNG